MLIFLSLLIVVVISTILILCNYEFWDKDMIEIIGYIIDILAGVFLFIIILILITGRLDAPIRQAAYEERYYKLQQKITHIDSFNKADVINEIDAWNKEYRINTYGAASPWVNWFYTIDTKTTSLIEVNY